MKRSDFFRDKNLPHDQFDRDKISFHIRSIKQPYGGLAYIVNYSVLDKEEEAFGEIVFQKYDDMIQFLNLMKVEE